MSSRENVKQTKETKPINTDPKSSMIPNSDVGEWGGDNTYI